MCVPQSSGSSRAKNRGLPDEGKVAFEQGTRAFTRRKIDAALEAFDRAESLGYNPAECAAYRWDCWMLLGRFEEAWRESDLIARRGWDTNALWDGEPFSNKRVIIRCLHGYGDAIQFLRYAGLVRQTASRIIVETHPEMMSLVGCVRSVDEVVTWTTGLPRESWDQQIEVTELPRAFRTSLCTIPADIPYVVMTKKAQALSRRNLGGSDRLKVGLLWGSGLWNPERSATLEQFRPVLEITGLGFYSFQRGAARDELEGSAAFRNIHDTSAHSASILDTAADLINMDLLITVDTMAAHLAGALGKTVWTLLPYEADWRWMLGRSDTPWYPTMRLFRQKSQGDWRPVIDEIVEELRTHRF